MRNYHRGEGALTTFYLPPSSDRQRLDDTLGGAEQFFGIGRFARGCHLQALLQLRVEGGAALGVPLCASLGVVLGFGRGTETR